MSQNLPTVTVFATKAARLAFMREVLTTKPKWAMRALSVIYQQQTAGEQVVGSVTEDNGVGFTSLDADILTSFAKQVIKWEGEKAAGTAKYATPLSEKQMALLHKKIGKYAAQLLKLLDASGNPCFVVDKALAKATTVTGVAA